MLRFDHITERGVFMIILLFLILLVLLGIVAVDVSSTLIGGAAAIVLFVIIFIVRSYKNAKRAAPPELQQPHPPMDNMGPFCDDCKYCLGDSTAGTCLMGHPNPQNGVFSPACKEDFLLRSAAVPSILKEKKK